MRAQRTSAPAGKARVQELTETQREDDGDTHDRGHPHRRVSQHRGQCVLIEEARIVGEARRALVEPGHRVTAERGAHEGDGGIDDDRGDQGQTRAEPEESFPEAGAAAAPGAGPRQTAAGAAVRPEPGVSAGKSGGNRIQAVAPAPRAAQTRPTSLTTRINVRPPRRRRSSGAGQAPAWDYRRAAQRGRCSAGHPA